MVIHQLIRTILRTLHVNPPPSALAASDIAAIANPEPTMKMIMNIVLPRTPAASASTPYQPSITASAKCVEDCARLLPMIGSASARTDPKFRRKPLYSK